VYKYIIYFTKYHTHTAQEFWNIYIMCKWTDSNYTILHILLWETTLSFKSFI